MARNNELGAAKTAKKDEFYTQLTDIEKRNAGQFNYHASAQEGGSI